MLTSVGVGDRIGSPDVALGSSTIGKQPRLFGWLVCGSHGRDEAGDQGPNEAAATAPDLVRQ